MDPARQILTILIALTMLSTGMLAISQDKGEVSASSIDVPETRAIPWNQVVDGTEITIAPGRMVNSSYYYPVPIGSTVLSANVSYSNIPYTDGGDDYSSDAWFNVGGSPKEYIYGVTGEEMYGQWGKQTMSRLGEKWFEFLLDGTNRNGGKFLLPKNATMTSAKFNITGFQRASEYEGWIYPGLTAGDQVGHVVRDMSNRYIAMGAPGISTSSGSIYIITGTMTTITVYTLTTGTARLSELGYSISNPFTIAGSTTQRFATGAPGYDNNRGYIDIMNLATAYSNYQKLEGNSSGDRFGESIGAGDIDGDGDTELIVGAPSTTTGSGKVFVYHQVLDVNGSGQFELLTVINGSISDTDFGKSIAVDDINGDKFADIVIASNEDVYIYHGQSVFDVDHDNNLDPLSTHPTNTIQNVKFLGRLSTTSSPSLGVALPRVTNGAALVYHGGAAYDTTADVTFTPPTGTSVVNFGWDMDGGYDINNDGRPEVAIGAPGNSGTRGWAGIYSTTSPTSPLDSFTSPAINDNYGSSVAFGTDLRGDGFGDVVMGAPTTMDVNNNRVGAVRIQERVPTEGIPQNKPVVYIGGNEAWRYSGDHIPIGTEVTTGDLSAALNTYIQSASVGLNTPHDGYVYVDIEIDMATFSDQERSNQFNLTDFELVYDYQRATGDIAQAFNEFMESPPQEAVDNENRIIKVPFKYGGTSEGGMRIETIDIEVDLVPEIEGIVGLKHVNEDSHTMNLIDTHLMFEDDNTIDEELEYSVFKSGLNSTKFVTYLVDNRYVAIDLPNGTDSANWTGEIQIYVVALDVNGGRKQSDDITIIVDPVNDAPSVTRTPDGVILQGALFQYLPHAVDAESDDINYTLKEGHYPENMTIDTLGTVLFEPNGWQIGVVEWIMVLRDEMDEREYNFSLEVINVNDAPIFINEAPIGEEVPLGDTFSMKFIAYDLDPLDLVRYSLPEGPTGSSIGFESGSLSWTPLIYLDGPQKFRVKAIDLEGKFTELVFYVNVTFIDNAPTINTTPETSIYDFIEWVYEIEVIDLDNDIVFIELFEGPDGMIFDSDISDSVIWTPTGDQIGEYDVSLRITSTRYELFQNFTVSVSRSPRAWNNSLDTSKDGTKVKGKTDIGGSASVSPSTIVGIWVEIGEDDPLLIPVQGGGWTYEIDTNHYNDGDLIIKVTATDGVVNSTTQTITLKVVNDEGKTSPVVVILIIVMIVIILVIAALGIVVYMRIQKKKAEDEEKKAKAEELERSKEEVEKFLQTADHIEGDTSAFDNVQQIDVDENRLEAIDSVFAPMAPGQCIEDMGLIDNDIPEDILQKACVQESVLDETDPVEHDEQNIEDDPVPYPESTSQE